jgi:hypothetical protein
MVVFALTVGLVLAQAPSEPATQAAPPPDAADPSSDGTQPPATTGGSPGADPAVAAMKKQAEELARAATRLKDLVGPERDKALEDLRKKSQALIGSPVIPPRDFNFEDYASLSESDQALVVARSFFEALVSGDAGRVVDYAGVPFLMEDRRIERPSELRSTWARHLRSKRTDLITLYGIEVLTPVEMEKKYGQPPPRLRSWPWRQSQQQFIAVANLSGRAAIVVMKAVGATWQVIAYHD